MDFKIIQWNLAGFFRHYEEVRNLMNSHNPAILMIQETHFNSNDNNNRILKGYRFERHDDPTATQHRKGGSAIGIRRDFKYDSVPLQTDFQAVAVRIFYPMEFTVCSIYIPPGEKVSEQRILELLRQLPPPILIGGDLNARNIIWGSDRSDNRGKTIEKAMNSEDLNLLNSGDNTHFSSAYQSYSAIDVTFASPIIELSFDWAVLGDSMGSDHFPIVMTTFQGGSCDQVRPKWKLDKADWEKFDSLISNLCNQHPHPSATEFTELLIQAADESIPRSKGNAHRPQVPWWTDEIKISIQERRRAERKCRKSPSQENIINFRRAQAKTRRLMRHARRSSFRKFIKAILCLAQNKKSIRRCIITNN